MIKMEINNSDRCNGDFSVYVSFPYDIDFVNIMRSFSTRYWHKESRKWEIPLSKLSEAESKFANYDVVVSGKDKLEAKKEIELPVDFEFKTKPFQHQIEGFDFGLSHDRWLLGDEQGLGKTKQVIDIAIAKKLQYNYKHCLIICGVNGLKWNWVKEIETHSNESAWILGQRSTGKRIQIGTTRNKLEDLYTIDEIDAYFLITNVESLRDTNISNEIANLCERGVIGLVAIDEIHKCKNPQSQQGKGILKIKPECRIAMTGTPLMNTPLDLFIILKWLGYEKHSYYAFKNHFCVMGGYGDYQIVGYKNLNELQEELDEIMLRRLKQDVIDLPEKTRINEYVEMTPKQAQIYNEVTMDIRMNIDKIEASPNPLAELIRMRQATGYTGILSSEIRESAKLDRMEELVEEAVENGKKVVIFSNWTQMTDAIFDRLNKNHYNPLLITGGTPDSVRQEYVDLFQAGMVHKVIIGTIGAMGTGITLTAGTVEIFMDEPWNMALKEQAEDRCHRVGTKENITIYTLICKDTIDEKINEIVEQKGAMANALVDGKIANHKEELLNYLIG